MLPPYRYFPNVKEQRQDDRRCEQAGLRTVAASAPQFACAPCHFVARLLDPQTADVGSEERQGSVPAEMQADGQPQVAGPQVGVAEENAESSGVGDADLFVAPQRSKLPRVPVAARAETTLEQIVP